ncbi:MAG TPA: YCF48-related protein, partial [Pyrinomonadaceae bacterium]
GVSADLYDVKFINDREGWAVGAEGTVIYTADGGISWTKQVSATTHPLERVFITDRSHGWAVGFGGTVVVHGTVEAPRLSSKP